MATYIVIIDLTETSKVDFLTSESNICTDNAKKFSKHTRVIKLHYRTEFCNKWSFADCR